MEYIYTNGCPRKNGPLSILKISSLLSMRLKPFLLPKDSAWNSLQKHIWLGPKTVLDRFEKWWKYERWSSFSLDF